MNKTKRKVGRPKILDETTTFSVRLPKKHQDMVSVMQIESRTTISNLVRHLIEQGYETHTENLRKIYETTTKNEISFDDFRETYSNLFGINSGKVSRRISKIRGE
jgi:hypothetical protein